MHTSTINSEITQFILILHVMCVFLFTAGVGVGFSQPNYTYTEGEGVIVCVSLTGGQLDTALTLHLESQSQTAQGTYIYLTYMYIYIHIRTCNHYNSSIEGSKNNTYTQIPVLKAVKIIPILKILQITVTYACTCMCGGYCEAFLCSSKNVVHVNEDVTKA